MKAPTLKAHPGGDDVLPPRIPPIPPNTLGYVSSRPLQWPTTAVCAVEKQSKKTCWLSQCGTEESWRVAGPQAVPKAEKLAAGQVQRPQRDPLTGKDGGFSLGLFSLVGLRGP